jgi:hypothetical protein
MKWGPANKENHHQDVTDDTPEQSGIGKITGNAAVGQICPGFVEVLAQGSEKGSKDEEDD